MLHHKQTCLADGEKRPETPDYLKGVPENQRDAKNINPSGAKIYTLVECNYFKQILNKYRTGQMDQDLP